MSRSGSASSATSVQYATANGSAAAGTDYTAASGTLSWASGDTSAKTITVPIASTAAFAGTKTFSVALQNASGSAIGTPQSATVTIDGTTACAQTSSSYVTTGIYSYVDYGNYYVVNNNWGGTPNQQLFANSQNCWGVTTNATAQVSSPGSYPSVVRGWSDNGGAMQTLSDSGTWDWTTKSGMGIQIGQITKAQVSWAFTAPTATGDRWMALMDIYFHQSPSPSYTAFPPYTDLMIDQALMDQAIGGQPTKSSTYYAYLANGGHGTVVTLGGNKYVIYIDNGSELGFHNGGHTIHLFLAPTTFSDGTGLLWGSMNAKHDLKAIITYLMQASPKDDAGNTLIYTDGTTVTSPLLTPDLYLNAINAGWEILTGTAFTNSNFCVAMQNEPDCP